MQISDGKSRVRFLGGLEICFDADVKLLIAASEPTATANPKGLGLYQLGQTEKAPIELSRGGLATWRSGELEVVNAQDHFVWSSKRRKHEPSLVTVLITLDTDDLQTIKRTQTACLTLYLRTVTLQPTGFGISTQPISRSKTLTVADTPFEIAGRSGKPEQRVTVASVVADALKGAVASVQDYAILCGQTLRAIFTVPYYAQDILQQMDAIGAGSLPIILLSGFFIGTVMVLQTGSQFTRFGQSSLTGDVVAIALVRELGPSLTGLLVTGRCATGIASELGSMLVTEQVDAMRAMGTDPIRKLVAPRTIATLLTLPLLTAMTDFMGLMGGCVASVFSLRLSAIEFWRRAVDALDFADLMQGFTKPFFFAFILATMGCYKGLTVRGGTQGVGRATTQAAVASSVMIIVADAFLSKIALYLAGKLF